MSADAPTYIFFFVAFGFFSFVAFLALRYDLWQERRQAIKDNEPLPLEKDSKKAYAFVEHIWMALGFAIIFSLIWHFGPYDY